jgi:hypothetical protein
LDAPVVLTPDTDKVLWFGVAGIDGYLNRKENGEYVFKVVRKDGSIYTFSFTYDKEEVEGVELIEAEIDYKAVWDGTRDKWYIKVTVPGEDLDQDSIASIEMVRKAGELLDAPVALTPDTDKVLWFGVAGRNGYLNGNVGEYVFKVVRKDGSIYTFSFTYDKEEVKDVVGKFDAQIDYQAVYNGRKDKYQIKIYVPGEDFDIQNVQSITIIKEAGTVLAEPKPVIVTIDKVLWFEVADSEANLFAGNDGDYTYQVVRLDGSIYTFDFNYDVSKVKID